MSTNRQTLVLDTSVLLSAGKQALFSYPNSDLIIPLPVIVELEKKKDDPLVGFMARAVLRTIEEWRTTQDIAKGVEISGGTRLHIETNHVSDNSEIPSSVRRRGGNDVLILTVLRNLYKENSNVSLVSNDLSMRILSQVALGIPAREHLRGSHQGNYEGLSSAFVAKSQLDTLYSPNGYLEYDEVRWDAKPRGANTAVMLTTEESKSVIALGDGKLIHRMVDPSAFGMRGRSARQKVALNYLLNPDLPVVSLGGPAGTGKTLLALAAGLDGVLEQRLYKKIVVFRPVTAVGNEQLGYLPGTEKEKMDPWAGAIYDAMEAISDNSNIRDEVVATGKLEILPVTHIRGRTFTNAFVIVDEAQNLERNTLLSVLSRAGEGTKTVFSWDAAQKDNLHIGKEDGIVAVVDRLRQESDFAHITLNRSERSRVAEMASRILEEF